MENQDGKYYETLQGLRGVKSLGDNHFYDLGEGLGNMSVSEIKEYIEVEVKSLHRFLRLNAVPLLIPCAAILFTDDERFYYIGGAWMIIGLFWVLDNYFIISRPLMVFRGKKDGELGRLNKAIDESGLLKLSSKDNMSVILTGLFLAAGIVYQIYLTF